MCEQCHPTGGWSRRRLLTAGFGAVAALAVPVRVEARTRTLDIMPRSAWAGTDRQPTGTLFAETDVRFLLVHHTVNANTYAESDVARMIRSFYDFHTGPEKGWPDVAYNFLVDRFGRVWEARQGSIAGAVVGSATGGNQGYDQKAAFIGDHSSEPPSDAAQTAMTELLAWLADRHGIDTTPGTEVEFVSRGSNRHASGVTVRTPTINGHRSMSNTACPGDAGYKVVTDDFPAMVTSLRGPTTTTPTTTTSTTTSTAPAAPSSTAAPETTTTSTTEPVTVSTTEIAIGPPTDDSPGLGGAAIAAAGSAVVAAGAGVLVFLRNRGSAGGGQHLRR